ncbi:hypothetical protein PF010_g7107 [Phytophthora fragariae]|uniref:Uncharacterized protein n=1 Tax=Phytophthora fragariae TaxID=53985 RepID=A0A6A3LE33_9STRA|nr:hypothetical protein PF011_g6741 [Phytophthora fragariae]KAE9121426.1 hypothetical protein PF010_g7107 [Phytophthora fragariae]KAE9242454.1 hypothetical protein PF004_g6590 [Phytophthora fragariae]
MIERLLTSASYVDAVLPTTNTYFAFDGTNSDLARQLYLRAKAGANAPQFKSLSVPTAVQDRLDGLGLAWKDLPGIAQRAVLWDSGFGVTSTNDVVQIWTLSGHSMTDLAVPLVEFQDVGCVETNCTQPDNTTSWSNLYCNGDQMLRAARCVVEDFTDKSDIHLAMWETGGNPEVVPAPTVRKHAWTDESSGVQYNVVAVHTLELDDEPAYDECASSSQNGGYGSLVLPCYTTADVPDAIKSARESVQGSAWVSRWLVEDYSGGVTSGNESSGLNLAYVLPPICGVLVACGLVWLFVYSRRRRREVDESDPLEDSLIDGEGFHPLGVKDAPLPQDEFAPNQSSASTLNSSANGTIDRSAWLRSSTSSFDQDFGSGSNNTLKILLSSEFLVPTYSLRKYQHSKSFIKSEDAARSLSKTRDTVGLIGRITFCFELTALE